MNASATPRKLPVLGDEQRAGMLQMCDRVAHLLCQDTALWTIPSQPSELCGTARSIFESA